ncbi:hypothetical protein N5P37_006126 [Trichoderma harzianum]|uniref:Uncharacterized protein n=1 Tax=Trichoderma harzianum CBS 226.95 TaxID=983964 RepID=A0A2T4AAB8_TRIHA|nr:hypothetical protein M431DRAFT_6280 [Trichoderma harzianum CBS 226.95]KAK0761180.1 hypothetical protein N5P37_006126 [Trichoderma harzianum]PKK53247.1 hypothetical protein CI102_1916 [Trichoderma harzianum]PTB54029.1 hypothetical protein M431DRAFT_6280 [Trichoderma harzianum CBS 226.95]
MANSLILGSSPIFGRVDSFIFEDWVTKIDWDKKIEELGSDKFEETEMVLDLRMAGYFPAPYNKIVVYEVAYTKQYQIIWSFLCKKTDVTDAQAKALSEVQKTPEITELKRKWVGTWEGISTKEFHEVRTECSRTFDDEEGSTVYPELREMLVTEFSNGVVMKVMHIMIE